MNLQRGHLPGHRVPHGLVELMEHHRVLQRRLDECNLVLVRLAPRRGFGLGGAPLRRSRLEPLRHPLLTELGHLLVVSVLADAHDALRGRALRLGRILRVGAVAARFGRRSSVGSLRLRVGHRELVGRALVLGFTQARTHRAGVALRRGVVSREVRNLREGVGAMTFLLTLFDKIARRGRRARVDGSRTALERGAIRVRLLAGRFGRPGRTARALWSGPSSA